MKEVQNSEQASPKHRISLTIFWTFAAVTLIGFYLQGGAGRGSNTSANVKFIQVMTDHGAIGLIASLFLIRKTKYLWIGITESIIYWTWLGTSPSYIG